MVPRRRGRGFLVLAAILIIAGLFAMFYGASPSGSHDTAAIPANDATSEYFTQYSWSVLSGGAVHGTFSVTDGTPITVFVYNDADYNAYVNGENLTGLYTVTAASGSIDLQVNGWNTYHIVFAHAPNYTSREQDVSVNLTSTGIDPGYFLGGLAATVIGAVVAVVASRRARRSAGGVPAGVLESRATYTPPPAAPPAPGTTASGDGAFRVPPPLPGAPEAASAPIGNIVVTVENRSSAAESVQLLVNGAAAASLSLSPGTSQVTTVTARLASAFGSMVSVQAITSSGRRAEESVFVGAGGTAQIQLRIG